MEFKALAAKVEKSIESTQEQSVTEDDGNTTSTNLQNSGDRNYKLANTEATIIETVRALLQGSFFAFDTETTGLDIVSDYPIGVSFSNCCGHATYIPLHDAHLNDIEKQKVIEILKPLFENTDIIKIAHNTKFDLQMLWNSGIEPIGPFEDTMLQGFTLKSSRMKFGIDSLCEEYFGAKENTYDRVTRRKKEK